MILVAETLVLGLAAYRVWRLVAVDDITSWVPGRDSRLVSCPWCLGSWLAVLVTVAAWWFGLIVGSPWLVAPAAAVVVGVLGDRL